MNLAAVILAAGYSSRLGRFKPLVKLGGRSFVAYCAGLLREAGIENVVVVAGHRRQEVADEAERCGARCLYNRDHDEGMYSSVRVAVSHLQGVDGLFLLPVDMPLIRPATIKTLCGAFDGRSVVHPCFNGLRGHPPLIPGNLIPAILGYDGTGGLKALLEKLDGREVAVWDRSILMDADTPEDLALLEKRWARLAIGEESEVLALARLAMPERGVAHGLAVARVARRLGEALNLCGAGLDIELLANAALLHDVAKGQAQHERRGAEMLRSLGLPHLAEIVAAHRDVAPPASGRLSEKEVVCLADKLVRGPNRVSIRQRFAEKLQRYAADSEACLAIQGRQANAAALQALAEQIAGRRIEDIIG